MEWTLQHGATTQSLEAWGISGAQVTLRSFAASTLTFAISGNFDAADAWVYADQITLRDPENVVRFTGKVRQLPLRTEGSSESRACVVEDVLGDLNRRFMRQYWVMWQDEAEADVQSGALVLFDDGDGGTVGLGLQLAAVIAAAAAAGIAVQMGAALGMTAVPQKWDIKDATYLEVLKVSAKLVPDLCTQVDYTTTPPTVDFIRRINATSRDIAVIETADAFECAPLHDQQISGVIILYEQPQAVDGVLVIGPSFDAYPAETTGDEENALVITTQLGTGSAQPSAMQQSQALGVRAIDEDSFTWWEYLWPDLALRNEGATLTDTDVSSATLVNQIVTGQTPDWTGSSGQVTVSATFNGLINGIPHINARLVAVVNATTLSSGTYTRVSESGTTLQAVPTGIAELLYTALNPLQWTGHHAAAANELTWGVLPGDVVNFTGTARAALTTARALVQQVTYNIDTATRNIQFGPSPNVSFEDLLDLIHGFRQMAGGSRAAERAGTSAGEQHTVLGAGLGPGATLSIVRDTDTHAWKVTKVGVADDLFRVEGGSYDGVAVAAATSDIGTSRPRYIYISAEWTVTAWQERFAATVERTGTAPAIASTTTSTSTDMTIPEGATSTKHLVAVIGTGDVITQAESDNLAPVWEDNGGLAGEATMISS